MFSKPKTNDPIETKSAASRPAAPAPAPSGSPPGASASSASSTARQPKPAPSIISADLTITGNLETSGDMQIEGTVEGDIRSHMLTVGQTATVRGEIIADDVIVNGRVIGRIRGMKVRLSSSGRVEGDVIHKTIAIESGAHFEGSVQRSDDPLGEGAKPVRQITGPGGEK